MILGIVLTTSYDMDFQQAMIIGLGIKQYTVVGIAFK